MSEAVEAGRGETSATVELGTVLIGTPCYGGQVTVPYMLSALATVRALDAHGVPHGWLTTSGESLVQRARNSMVARFMDNQAATHLVFIDADIEWQADDFIRLLAHDRDVVCGLYPKKRYPIEFAFMPRLDAAGCAVRDPKTGAIRISNGATGFMAIKRSVIERMMTAYPELRYRLGGEDEPSPYQFSLFDCLTIDGVFHSEDYGFCRRWEAIGGEVWFDPAIKLRHHGAHAYEGDPGEVFKLAPEAAAA